MTATKSKSLITDLYRKEYARVLSAVLLRVRDIAFAEDAVQEAFMAAAEQWTEKAPPEPRAWLIRVAVNKAIDRQRRRSKFLEVGAEPLEEMEAQAVEEVDMQDERLRLIFTCCHPAI